MSSGCLVWSRDASEIKSSGSLGSFHPAPQAWQVSSVTPGQAWRSDSPSIDQGLSSGQG
jgi:hypothetical protein